MRCFELVAQGTQYAELGGAYFDQRRKDAVTRRMVKRLEELGFDVNLKPRAA